MAKNETRLAEEQGIFVCRISRGERPIPEDSQKSAVRFAKEASVFRDTFCAARQTITPRFISSRPIYARRMCVVSVLLFSLYLSLFLLFPLALFLAFFLSLILSFLLSFTFYCF